VGAQAEVDFYQAEFDLPWGRERAQVIALRSEFSGLAFHAAYPALAQSAMLEGIALGLSFAGGVFPTLRFDNLPLAVAKVLKGPRRVERDWLRRVSAPTTRSTPRSPHLEKPGPTRREASKEKRDIFGATTGYRCPKQRISPIGTGSWWKIANTTNSV